MDYKESKKHIDVKNLPEMLGYLRLQPAFLLRRSQQILASLYARECISSGINLSQVQLEALCVILAKPGLKQLVLAKHLGIDRSSVTVLINNLSKLKLVKRMPGKDRREYSLQLSKKAPQVLNIAFSAAKKSASALLLPLGGKDRTKLLKLLSQMAYLHHLPAPKWEPYRGGEIGKLASSRIKINKLYEMPGFLLDRCSQIGDACLLEATKPYGLSSGQAGTLFVIALLGPIDQGALRRSVGADRSSVSVIVPTLVEKSLITKEKDQFDQRRMLVSCTKAGFDLIDRAQAAVEVAAKRCFEGLPEESEEKLCLLLTRLVAAYGDFN